MTGTRDRILTATNELFRRHGFNGTSLKQVTAAASAPTGSVYHFFPGGKDDLAEAVIATSGAAYGELFDVVADTAGDPATAVTDFFEGAADVLETTDYIDPCPIGTVAREVASTNDTLRQATDRVLSAWVDKATARFEAAGVARVAAADLATTIVAALEGGFVLARARRDSEPVRVAGRAMRRLADDVLASVPADRGR
jgi:AcrR family transcriptional regulator